jgi:hypothetical protein
LTEGIEGTTKEMIVRATGLSRKSIDRYFENKLDCALQVARWVGVTVWKNINEHFPKTLFIDELYPASSILEMYLMDLKKIFMKDARLFIFYTEFKIYFSRYSDDYEKDYAKLLETIGCRKLVESIYSLGIKDGSMHKDIQPESEAEYLCRACFGFLSNMALTYKYHPQKTENQIDRYISNIMYLYRAKDTNLITDSNDE